MGHEIYYTSVASGLRPMSRGLCTVGATDGIPPALWERLEALSGYRHPFDPDDPRNPIAHAHWILSIGGREYHILSRIIDSGFDYTRRNNSFAHHLAVDPEERATAGPAWLLSQPGVMAIRWNQQVGPIQRAAPLPRGDAPAAPCSAWQHLAGDAGWGGVLAEAYTENPARPVHLIYAPEQASQTLRLLAEAIALLPAGQRWGVTFHTYFTSMPGNVQCNWRCCLAGTPAANHARGLTGGLVIDLSRPLGPPPSGAWAQRARTGQAAPSRSEPAPTVARLNPRAPSSSRKQPAPIPLVEESPSLPAPVTTSAQTDWPDLPAPHPAPPPVHFNRASASTPTSARSLMFLYLLACAAAGVGIWMLVLASRPSTRPDPLPAPIDRPPDPPTHETRADTNSNHNTAPPPVNHQASNTVVKPPNDWPPVVLHTQATPRTVNTQPVVVKPRAQPFVMNKSLERMAAGSGIRSKPQVIPVAREAIDDIDTLARLSILFPGGQPDCAYQDANILGRLWSEPEPTAGGPGLSLYWKDTSGAGGKVKILTLHLEKAGPQVRIHWNTSAMLSQPDLQYVAFWILQNSQLLVASAPGEPLARLLFKPLDLPVVQLQRGSAAVELPCEFPSGILPRSLVMLPEGWSGSCEAEWPAADGGKRAPENATHTIRVKWDTSEVGFTITIQPGWSKIVTDLPDRRKALIVAVDKATSDLAQVTAELARIDVDARADLDPLEKKVAEFHQLARLSNAELESRSLTRQFVTASIRNLVEQIQIRSNRAQGAKLELEPRRAEAMRVKEEADKNLQAMESLKSFELSLELIQGVRVGRMRFELK